MTKYHCPSCGASSEIFPSDGLCGECLVPLKAYPEILDGHQRTLMAYSGGSAASMRDGFALQKSKPSKRP